VEPRPSGQLWPVSRSEHGEDVADIVTAEEGGRKEFESDNHKTEGQTFGL